MNNVWFFLVVFLTGLAIGIAGEANFSQHLILTHAEKQQAQAIAALNSKIKTMTDAAQASADERSLAELASSAAIRQLQKEVRDAATDKPALSANVVRLINAAGLPNDATVGQRPVSRAKRSSRKAAAAGAR